MKIKWKIVLAAVVIIVAMTAIIVSFTGKEVRELVGKKYSVELENYSNMGIQLFNKSYEGAWSIKNGNLYKGGTLINGNFEIIDNFTNGTNVLATVFCGDTRVTTNVMNDERERQIGTQASDIVIQTVLKEGKTYSGKADILGRTAQTYYAPIFDTSGEIIGMWFVGIYTDISEAEIDNTMSLIIKLSAILLVIGVIVSYFMGSLIAKGIKKIQQKVKMMEEGDFSLAFENKLTNRKDEVGIIASSAYNMQQKIAEIMREIQMESGNVNSISLNSKERMEDVNVDIADISATTQQLSAGMEETSASTEELNTSTYAIEKEVANMKTKTLNGENLVVEIKERADRLKANTEISKNTANNIYEKTNYQLRESIKKTEAIKEIKELSQAILAITSQTNLLALNASIEAARAGEAGKGFAVVADEIGKLADDSKNAVSRINDITLNVSDAVESVVEDSQVLLEFVDNQVLKDYEELVNISVLYNEDADKVREVVKEINESAEQLYETIIKMRKQIAEITTASAEGAQGTTDIAGKVADIASKAEEVLKQTMENQKSAEKLDEMIGFFKL